MLQKVVYAVLAAGFFSPSLAWPQSCTVNPTYRFYAVAGTTVGEIKDSLLERGPRDGLGAARFAYTDWKVKWKWQRLADGSINPDSVELACIAEILLPYLEPNAAVEPELRAGWGDFVERTRQHELNHVAHLTQRAPEIYQRLRAAAQHSGTLSSKRAEAIVSEVIAEIRALDRRYDAETDHGRTEGAWQIVDNH